MSAAVMQSTYPTQHCGCDFCNSRRSVNAKKLAVSQKAAQQRADCTCECHTKGRQQNGGTGFDPEYPAPVNQTALNASRGRNGVPGGNQYTIKNQSTRAGESGLQGSGNDASAKETAEQRQARETAELDGLERLLIAEYKARTQATLEAERLKASSTNASARRPQPLPEGYASGGVQDNDNAGYNGEPGTWGRSGPVGSGSYGQDASTIHEAYAMAQDCPATPPAQCHASHRLQDTMDDVRKVTGDPVNTNNRRALQRLLNKNGLGGGEDGGSGTSSTRGDSTGNKGARENAFGSSLAQLRTSTTHPRGAGVVWVPTVPLKSSVKDTDVLVIENAAGEVDPAASGSATGVAAQQSSKERHVTYAV
ncbi:putative mitochondrial hypothetical protein [Leptomonas pyrrhocoris]|uniref:Uncharacterized protein n=1 Tax=Leptomonas pyrrhocoris TaxID=157538 RepID=A0A0M9G824_LEPPY|nr:putative mitochondrial hypothetical protein [Leptomonas pyrrhocoris]XP_015662967.1 putative mitochondrial hypothetical protein [Leptomonas pyrrhocoris]XP_015662968.1 putative mitochondrial hypothetical protein [Leptomonas pyrrhocoris]KPA84527.1 putative mitochondrial hypothetical protein [Leptomonas pyrrhocoris]KPA84528.1 putative mitochondrial hypothetical protein [Leptomonas pyrrhocoris]KPA84529.1 putative mitochondrial hypothetical protein [Leptomonas pyrrhocoris]|eukprot:XP_015662966.1 putative mitochondrial hypothetical protein [Leptomonas pyrrhocoris]